MISKEILRNIENDIKYIQMFQFKLDILKEIIIEADQVYYNDKEPILSDKAYDGVREFVLLNDPTFKSNQHSDIDVVDDGENGGIKVKLPVWMGSMKKVKPDKVPITNNVVISDKLDGVSCLVYKDTKAKINLYTRGNGNIGRDITKLLPFITGIDKKKIENNIMVRGELIMKKDTFNNLKTTESNPRNTVAGFVNSKTPNNKFKQKIDFIAYEMIQPTDKTPLEQLNLMKSNQFNIVSNRFENIANKEILSDILHKRKMESVYEIDGIIVTQNINYKYITKGNPIHAFAYKESIVENHKKTKVIKVEWNISKDRYIKPIIHIEEVNINNVIIKKTTGYNAKFITDNKIGKGTEVTIERSGDVIPKIVSIDKSTQADMPEYPYIWNDSGVDICVSKDNVEQKDTMELKTFQNMMTKLDIKNMGPSTIQKLFKNNIRTIKKVYKLEINKIEEFEGFSKVSATNLHESINSRKKDLKCIDYMVASNSFGRGFAQTVIESIIVLHNPITSNIVVSDLQSIKGIGDNKAKSYIEGLSIFKKFAKDNDLEDLCKNDNTTVTKVELKSTKLKNINFLFTGFRDKDIEQFIKDNGGVIKTGAINNNIDYIIFKGKLKDKAIEGAKKFNIDILDVDAFKKSFDYNK